MSNHRSVKNSLIIMCLGFVLVTSIILSAISIIGLKTSSDRSLSTYKDSQNSGYNTEIKSEIQTVITVLNSEYQKYKDGILSEAEAKKEALNTVRAMRYRDDQSGYFWIDDTDYNLVMHPILADQEGNNRHDLKDQNGVFIIQVIMDVANSPEGGGYNEFYFTKADGVTVAPKVAYSQIFKPWGWVVSTGNYVDDMNADMADEEDYIQHSFTELSLIIVAAEAILLLITFIVARLFGIRICKPLDQIQKLASRFSAGDFTQQIQVHSRNEFGKTAEALNIAQSNISSLVNNIKQTSDNLTTALNDFSSYFSTMKSSIEGVSIAVNEIATNTTSQADSTNDTSSSMQNVSTDIQNANDEITALQSSTTLIKDYSDRSFKILGSLINTSNNTRDNIQEMYNQTQNTNDSVNKISQAASLIS